ncbi:MAG: hypothetical protein ACYC6M_09955 [Terriglobales bacterium]
MSTPVLPPSEKRKPALPIWFFIGWLLLVYGILLVGGGLYQLQHPPDTVLARLHATLWAGGVLTAMGLLYVILYRPGRKSRHE